MEASYESIRTLLSIYRSGIPNGHEVEHKHGKDKGIKSMRENREKNVGRATLTSIEVVLWFSESSFLVRYPKYPVLASGGLLAS